MRTASYKELFLIGRFTEEFTTESLVSSPFLENIFGVRAPTRSHTLALGVYRYTHYHYFLICLTGLVF